MFLLVKLLDKYLYFFSNELPGLEAEAMNELIQTIVTQFNKIRKNVADGIDHTIGDAFRLAKDHFDETL